MKSNWRKRQTRGLEMLWRCLNPRVPQGGQGGVAVWGWAAPGPAAPHRAGAEHAATAPSHPQVASGFPSAVPPKIKPKYLKKKKHVSLTGGDLGGLSVSDPGERITHPVPGADAGTSGDALQCATCGGWCMSLFNTTLHERESNRSKCS